MSGMQVSTGRRFAAGTRCARLQGKPSLHHRKKGGSTKEQHKEAAGAAESGGQAFPGIIAQGDAPGDSEQRVQQRARGWRYAWPTITLME